MSSWNQADQAYMARAIQLAEAGLYTTHPNPRVGCVLVKDNSLIAEGFHYRAGEGHAEVQALAAAGQQAQGATAYVTLEPCSHYGRTPPCAEALIQAGVKRVVAAMIDPNPAVAGRGLECLRQAGIEVHSGVLETEARALNPGFIRRMETGLPFVRVKLATSLDGRTAMASGESKWITGPAARADVQKLRARSSAILTGIESILQDDSALTLRKEQLAVANVDDVVQRQPLRVVLDSQLRMPLKASILRQSGRTLIATLSDDLEKISALEQAGAEVIRVAQEAKRVALGPVLHYLAEQEQCNELLVETGATLAGAFMQEQRVDEVHLYMAMTLLGSQARPAFVLPFTQMSQQLRLQTLAMSPLEEDLKLILKPQYGGVS